MRKLIAIVLGIVLLLCSLTGCVVANATEPKSAPSTPELSIQHMPMDFSTIELPKIEVPSCEEEIPTIEAPSCEESTEASSASTIIPETSTHKCAIERAREEYHRFSCDECENYTRVNHDETTMECLVKNEWFHTWECSDCGYEYAEEHNFSIAFNSAFHKEVCVDCGYAKTPEDHILVSYYWSNYHDIECEECGYLAERHVGVQYTSDNAQYCAANCVCGAHENIEHDWDGFVCDNCNYTMSGDTYLVVSRVLKTEDGYRVRFTDINGTHRIDMQEKPQLKEGDFVKISHYGNDIFGITVLVDGDIVTDEENFLNYIYSNEIDISDDTTFLDLVIKDFEYGEDHLRINYESTRSTWYFNEIVVYDLIDAEMGELNECYAYLTMHVDNITYFICFW